MLQWFIRFPEFMKVRLHLGKLHCIRAAVTKLTIQVIWYNYLVVACQNVPITSTLTDFTQGSSKYFCVTLSMIASKEMTRITSFILVWTLSVSHLLKISLNSVSFCPIGSISKIWQNQWCIAAHGTADYLRHSQYRKLYGLSGKASDL